MLSQMQASNMENAIYSPESSIVESVTLQRSVSNKGNVHEHENNKRTPYSYIYGGHIGHLHFMSSGEQE